MCTIDRVGCVALRMCATEAWGGRDCGLCPVGDEPHAGGCSKRSWQRRADGMCWAQSLGHVWLLRAAVTHQAMCLISWGWGCRESRNPQTRTYPELLFEAELFWGLGDQYPAGAQSGLSSRFLTLGLACECHHRFGELGSLCEPQFPYLLGL